MAFTQSTTDAEDTENVSGRFKSGPNRRSSKTFRIGKIYKAATAGFRESICKETFRHALARNVAKPQPLSRQFQAHPSGQNDAIALPSAGVLLSIVIGIDLVARTGPTAKIDVEDLPVGG